MTDIAESSAATVAARLERLPQSFWHFKVRAIMGTATFFDAFDSLSISMVLPVLAGLWHLSPGQIGLLLGISYLGQAIGAIGFGLLAERIGRVATVRLAIAVFTLFNLACAFAQTYDQLVWLRFLGGLGIGAEVPIAAAYISEIAKAKGRGAFVLFYELMFSIGLMGASLLGAWIVPAFGWQWLFVVGAAPAVLVLFMQRYCVESPRWLASRGRLAEADRNLTMIEAEISGNGARPLPPLPPIAAQPAQKPLDWRELFQGVYLKRTLIVWVLWATTYFFLTSQVYWLPTLYRTVYGLTLQQSLNLAFWSSVLAVIANAICALTIDRVGRKRWFTGVFVLTTLVGAALCIIGTGSLVNVIVLAWSGIMMVTTISLSLYVYTPEIYPTRMRSFGVSVATFWLRMASFLAPIVVGWILPTFGSLGIFVLVTGVAFIGAVTCFVGVAEGRGRVLEEFSP